MDRVSKIFAECSSCLCNDSNTEVEDGELRFCWNTRNKSWSWIIFETLCN